MTQVDVEGRRKTNTSTSHLSIIFSSLLIGRSHPRPRQHHPSIILDPAHNDLWPLLAWPPLTRTLWSWPYLSIIIKVWPRATPPVNHSSLISPRRPPTRRRRFLCTCLTPPPPPPPGRRRLLPVPVDSISSMCTCLPPPPPSSWGRRFRCTCLPPTPPHERPLLPVHQSDAATTARTSPPLPVPVDSSSLMCTCPSPTYPPPSPRWVIFLCNIARRSRGRLGGRLLTHSCQSFFFDVAAFYRQRRLGGSVSETN